MSKYDRPINDKDKGKQLIDDDVRVCIDCYMDHHEGRPMKDSSVYWTDNNTDENGEVDCFIIFSVAPCDCCGSTLAGERYIMAIWKKD